MSVNNAFFWVCLNIPSKPSRANNQRRSTWDSSLLLLSTQTLVKANYFVAIKENYCYHQCKLFFLHILDCRQLVKQLFFKELPQLLHCHPLVHRFSLQYEHKVQALSFCHHEKPPRPYPTGNPHPHAPWGLNSYARCLNTDLYVPRQSPIGGNTAHFKDWCSIL